jgi:hypothetical protein
MGQNDLGWYCCGCVCSSIELVHCSWVTGGSFCNLSLRIGHIDHAVWFGLSTVDYWFEWILDIWYLGSFDGTPWENSCDISSCQPLTRYLWHWWLDVTVMCEKYVFSQLGIKELILKTSCGNGTQPIVATLHHDLPDGLCVINH